MSARANKYTKGKKIINSDTHFGISPLIHLLWDTYIIWKYYIIIELRNI